VQPVVPAAVQVSHELSQAVHAELSVERNLFPLHLAHFPVSVWTSHPVIFTAHVLPESQYPLVQLVQVSTAEQVLQ